MLLPRVSLIRMEGRGPALVVAASGFLGLRPETSRPGSPPSMLLQMPSGARILDPVPVGQHHVNMVVERCRKNKTDAKHPVGIFSGRTSSEMPEVSNVYGVTRLGGGLKDVSRPSAKYPIPCIRLDGHRQVVRLFLVLNGEVSGEESLMKKIDSAAGKTVVGGGYPGAS